MAIAQTITYRKLTENDLEMIQNRIGIFESQTMTNKSVRPVMITSYGLVENEYSNEIIHQLTMQDLFR